MSQKILIFFIALTVLLGQTNRGGITGTVFDPTGAVVPNATVTLTNLGTGQKSHQKTSTAGTYNFPSLDPVQYSVEAEIQGFKKKLVENIKIDTASIETLDIVLETGSISSEVTVQAESTMINTENGTLSATINERQIRDVPLLNRSVLDLALTLPNVSGDAGSEDPVISSVTPCPGCNLSIGGGRPMSTLILADGANNTGVSLARTMVSFTPETVQEFTVQTSAFSAEYGSTGGGVINVTTKSGTNSLNGTALWYNRNPDFAAAPFTLAAANRPVATLKYNQFSGSAGGPLVIPKLYNGRNKTFWFGAVEPEYRRDHLDQYGLMPTDGMRQGNFSGLVNTASGWLPQSVVNQFQSSAPAAVAPLGDSTIYNNYTVVSGNQFTASTSAAVPFPDNTIPQSMLDSVAIKTLPYIASAGPYYVNSNGLISNIYSPRVLQQNEIRYTGRIDHIISDSNRLYGRYTITPITKTQGTPVSPTNDTATYSSGQQAMIADTHIFGPTLTNDLRLTYTHGRFSSTAAPAYDAQTGTNLNSLFGLPNITQGGVPAFNSLFPGSSLGGGSSTATGFGSGGSTEDDDKEERYAVSDIVYKVKGKMSWKFGGDFSRSLQNVVPLYGALGGAYTFAAQQTDSNNTSSGTGGSPWASFLLGVPNGSVTLRPVEIPYYYRWLAGSAFVQNDWKILPNLTLNIGMRYSLEMPRTEKYNHQGEFLPNLAQTMNLPSPMTLQDGEVITSTQIVPFAFAGIGGNSKYLTPPQYRDFEPRFGFAWSPKFLEAHHITLRGGYGLSHAPVSGFTQLPQPDFSATASYSSTAPSSTANPNYIMRLGENPPVISPTNMNNVIYGPTGAPPANGLTYLNSLYYQSSVAAFAVSPNYHTPYVNNWNTTLSWQANASTTVELAYSGSMGIHLFMPQEDINPKDSTLLSAQIAQNVSTTGTINDPLGRINLLTGKVIAIQNGTLGSPYLGFSSLYNWFDSSGNSIRHAGYISVVHRTRVGLTFNANYTLSKSIDDGSSAGGDKGILTPVGGQVGGQVAFGGTRADDRSVSTFNQTHVIHGSAIYDLPFGQGRRYLSNNRWLDYAVGGWSISGLERLASGFPFIIYLSDTNQLGDLTHSARPDIVSGVPVVNPLWSSSCPIGNGCQPYLNPAAFERPALGALGDAPRTLPNATGPFQQNFDGSIQKNFKLSESGKRRLQFRVDLLNAFNHPTFAVTPNNGGGADFMGAPSTSTLTTAAYNTWAAANNQPLYSSAAGVTLYNQIVANVNAQKVNGVLPANFFTTPLPNNFYGTAANSFNITTTQGYKLYQLRNAYSTTFGDLYNNNTPRFIQFGVKLFF